MEKWGKKQLWKKNLQLNEPLLVPHLFMTCLSGPGQPDQWAKKGESKITNYYDQYSDQVARILYSFTRLRRVFPCVVEGLLLAIVAAALSPSLRFLSLCLSLFVCDGGWVGCMSKGCGKCGSVEV